MKNLFVFLTVLLGAQVSMAESCMTTMKAVEQNEVNNPSCRAGALKRLFAKYQDKTLQGKGAASSHQIMFLNPSKGFSMVHNGQTYVGSVCCSGGYWKIKNSAGEKSLSENKDRSGLLIGGYTFKPGAGVAANISASSSESPKSSSGLGWDAQFSSGAKSSRGRN